MLKEELQNCKTKWSNFLSISNWLRKIKKGLEKLGYWFLLLVSPLSLLVLFLISVASFFIIMEARKHIPNNLFQNIEISLEIATSISILVAMVIFVITTVAENNRQSKARRQDFKIKKINRLNEYIIDKKPKIFEVYWDGVRKWDEILLPYYEYKEKLQNIELAKDYFKLYGLAETDLSQEQLELRTLYITEEQIAYDNFLNEKGEHLISFYQHLCFYGNLPKNSIYEEFRDFSTYSSFNELKSLLSEIEDFISIDSMIIWSLGEKTSEQLRSEVQLLHKEFHIRSISRVKGLNREESEKKKEANFNSELDALVSIEDKIDFAYQQFLKQYEEKVFPSKNNILESKLEAIEHIVSSSLTEALLS
jgi:hypothetical protein